MHRLYRACADYYYFSVVITHMSELYLRTNMWVIVVVEKNETAHVSDEIALGGQSTVIPSFHMFCLILLRKLREGFSVENDGFYFE